MQVRDFGRPVDGLAGAALGVPVKATAHQQPARKGPYTDVEVRDCDGKVLGYVVGDDCPKIIELMDNCRYGYSVVFTKLGYTADPRNRRKHVGGPIAEFTVSHDTLH